MSCHSNGSRGHATSHAHRLATIAAISAALLGTLAAPAVRADTLPRCMDQLSAPPIFVSGSTALEPLLKAIGPVLAAQTDSPYAIAYVKDGSCEGVKKFVSIGGQPTTVIAANAQVYYIDGSYDPQSPVPQCDLSDQANGVEADLSFSDVFVEGCTGGEARPADVADIQGPAQAMLFITHPNSTQQAISAEQAYLALGLGPDGEATPWTDPMSFFIRPDSSGTKQLISAALGLKAGVWKGIYSANGKNFGSSDVLAMVAAAATNADGTLGILGADVYDSGSNRSMVKALAFRAFKQDLAYWPDSSPTSFDKRNVRDGHYTPYGYAHIVAKVDGQGQLVNPKAQLIADLVNGQKTLEGVDIIKVLGATAHLIPQCAMRVQRDRDGGDSIASIQPDEPCDCYYESAATGNATPDGCTVCTDDGACGGGKCRNGFCEAK
jgi:hypothetical protein